MKTRKNFEIITKKSKGIAEARQYLANAKKTISYSPIDTTDRLYEDVKYVREACGIAYLAVLKAIDAWLVGNGTPNEKLPKSIEEYWAIKDKLPYEHIMSTDFSIVYQALHLNGYTQGTTLVVTIKEGLNAAKEIIDILAKN